MITIKMRKDVLCDFCTEPIDFMIAVIGAMFTIPLDIVLFPIEIIAFIIYKISGWEG